MVKEVIINGTGAINDAKLDADLRAAVATYTGFSRRPLMDGIVLVFENNASDADLGAAQGIALAHNSNLKTPEQQARIDLKTVAVSAVGVSYNDLTTVQLKALLAVLIMESGGLANDLTIRPLAQWLG